ncbi:Protein of uncharacterised function (DUF2732) [Serratia plymuthica]|jgi:hypothetical protein|uniref:DUF2732 domain-containing protein n=1 Tax=Serratia plymuthica TaxID=82996 RepID=UPI00217B1578|nr:DUF2732 domain-containing protein [Serratia plymuthica]CAI0930919.1 Protein of uncharacterised function (DUF2732) [Serratia plymuthica]
MNKCIIGFDPASGKDVSAVTVLLNDARMDERRNQAEVAAARLVRLAAYITCGGLSVTEAVELLRQEAEAIENQAQELH